jgi:hypothetical protein
MLHCHLLNMYSATIGGIGHWCLHLLFLLLLLLLLLRRRRRWCWLLVLPLLVPLVRQLLLLLPFLLLRLGQLVILQSSVHGAVFLATAIRLASSSLLG